MTTAALVGSPKNDPQSVKQWAAEDFAIAIGLLRECPFHGQPVKAKARGLTRKALAAGLIDPLDPAVQLFEGNTRALFAAAEKAAAHYSEHCEYCTASDEEDFE